MDKITNRFTSIEQVAGKYLKTTGNAAAAKHAQVSFEEILRKKQSKDVSELKFSKHASMRLEERNISLTTEQNARLQDGVERAREKGRFPCFYCKCPKPDGRNCDGSNRATG